jgi:hypothetical protein
MLAWLQLRRQVASNAESCALTTGTPHDYTCEDVGIYSSRDASGSLRQYTTEGPGAEVLGALLQTVWGVAPTHSAWHVLHNRTVSDYLWSLSDTPFSPFTR